MKNVGTNEVISVFTGGGDWDRFSLGSLRFINDYWYVLSAYGKFGDWEGYEIRTTAEIHKFHVGGKYEKFVASLADTNREKSSRFNLDFQANVSPAQIVLNLSKDSRIPIQVWGSDSSISEIGVVDEIKDGVLCFRIIDRYGKFDAKMMIDVGEVSAINIWSRELLALEMSMQKTAEVITI